MRGWSRTVFSSLTETLDDGVSNMACTPFCTFLMVHHCKVIFVSLIQELVWWKLICSECSGCGLKLAFESTHSIELHFRES